MDTQRYKKPEKLYCPNENIPDPVNVPEGEIWVIPNDPCAEQVYNETVEPLKHKQRRDWFGQHFYFCLPITMGNQHGWVCRSYFDIVARWNGGNEIEDTVVYCVADANRKGHQKVESHFGYGIVTFQNRWTYRTPKGINMMTVQPPNFPLHGIMHMTGVIECDNLRRDFTFNLKITKPNEDIFIPKGTPIGCVLPYPRHFIDPMEMKYLEDKEIIETEKKTCKHFAKARETAGHFPEGLYMQGVDVYKNKFDDHQKRLT